MVNFSNCQVKIKIMIFFFIHLFFLSILPNSVGINATEIINGQKEQKKKEQEIDLLLIRDLVLKQELELASKPQLYFLFNLREKRLELKARGFILKEWRIARIRRWGGHPAIKILTLEKKSALFAPKRKKIKPGEVQSGGTFELEALEVKDMPTIYTLRFDDGLKIYVRPGAKKFGGHIASIGFFLRWYGWFPIQNLFSQIFKKSPKLIEISLASSEEAKAIYWALLEGMKGLIFTLPESQTKN